MVFKLFGEITTSSKTTPYSMTYLNPMMQYGFETLIAETENRWCFKKYADIK